MKMLSSLNLNSDFIEIEKYWTFILINQMHFASVTVCFKKPIK